MNVDGRAVLLTGATGGIGHAIARAFAARSASLTLTGRRAEVLEPLAAETGGRAVACDLADREAVERLAAESRDVDILVANAALPASGRIDALTLEEIDAALDVNLRAPIVLAKRLSEAMVARRSGHLVFITSLAGKAASSGGSLYSATKFGLRGFALGLREDLRAHGVGVSVVAPGFIRDAGMFHESGATLPRGVGTKTPDDVAAAVLAAVERDRAELDVAPVALRAGAAFAAVAPGIASAVQRKLGSDGVSDAIDQGHRARRPAG
ncbi:MAG TPA: SDR family NAD(P)-dependent oxidoreductase [Solirubrobacteraceae bacterium]